MTAYSLILMCPRESCRWDTQVAICFTTFSNGILSKLTFSVRWLKVGRTQMSALVYSHSQRNNMCIVLTGIQWTPHGTYNIPATHREQTQLSLTTLIMALLRLCTMAQEARHWPYQGVMMSVATHHLGGCHTPRKWCLLGSSRQGHRVAMMKAGLL